MRCFLLVVAGALGGGCAAQGDTTIDITHDPCAPLAVLAPEASAAQFAAIQDALALWRDRGAPALGRRGAATATISIDFAEAASAFRGLYDDEAGVILINDALVDPRTLAIVVAHELGHAFGLTHVEPEDRVSLMNPGNITIEPTAEDQAALERRWGRCGGE